SSTGTSASGPAPGAPASGDCAQPTAMQAAANAGRAHRKARLGAQVSGGQRDRSAMAPRMPEHYIPATGSSMRVTPQALSDLGWPELLAELAARTHTQRGAQAARALAFASSSDEVGERSNEIAEVRRLRAEGPGLPWGGIEDVREALERVAKGGALESED